MLRTTTTIGRFNMGVTTFLSEWRWFIALTATVLAMMWASTNNADGSGVGTSIPAPSPTTTNKVRRTKKKKGNAQTQAIEGVSSLHAAVIGAFHDDWKGGAIVSYGDHLMLAVEFYGPLPNRGIDGEMVFVDKPIGRNRKAIDLGRIFLEGETIRYIKAKNENDFFRLLSKYKQGLSSKGLIDVKSGLPIYIVKIRN